MKSLTIACKPTPNGLIVTRPDYAGRKFGEVGQVLDELQLLFLARAAAGQGLRLMVEIQSDGEPQWPSAVPEEWVAKGEV